MQTLFVTHESDVLGVAAVGVLQNFGHKTRVLCNGEFAAQADTVFFTAEAQTKSTKRRFLYVSPHRFCERGIIAPPWATATPFQVAINSRAPIEQFRASFKDALIQISKEYSVWDPWNTPPEAPWSPRWTQEVPESFNSWQESAQHVVPAPTSASRIGRYLDPIFPATVPDAPTLFVIGCAAFNRPHTDVVNTLAQGKLAGVVDELARVIECGNFTRVIVVVAQSDILRHAVVRSHLHPFIFLSVEEAERMLGKPFREATRLWDRTHSRSDEEIGEAFDASAKAMVRQLVNPLQSKVAIPVDAVSWMSLVEEYLPQAVALVESNRSLLEYIYLERVRTRPSYKVMHDINPKAGIERTFGNAVLYVAEALYLLDHPECVVANCEVMDTYWKGLAPILEPLWRGHTPYIGMMRDQYRQPWGY